MKELKSIFLIIGSIIGAGFASGKEISVYFAQYGNYAIFYIIFIFILFSFLIYLTICFGNKINNNIDYKNIINIIFKKYKLIFIIFNFICLFIICSTMCSAFLETTKTNNIFIAFTIILCMILVCKHGLPLLTTLSVIIIPIVIIVMLIVLGISINQIQFIPKFNMFMLPINTFTYTAMNVYLSLFLIIKSTHGFTKKQSLIVASGSSIIICVILGLAIIVLNSNSYIMTSSFPFLELASKNNTLYFIYKLVFVFAIASTLFGTLISALDLLPKKHLKAINLVLPLCVWGFSYLGFSIFVVYLYPIISIVAIITFIKLLSFKPFFNPPDNNIH